MLPNIATTPLSCTAQTIPCRAAAASLGGILELPTQDKVTVGIDPGGSGRSGIGHGASTHTSAHATPGLAPSESARDVACAVSEISARSSRASCTPSGARAMSSSSTRGALPRLPIHGPPSRVKLSAKAPSSQGAQGTTAITADRLVLPALTGKFQAMVLD